jgi:hypothetical protein
MHGGREPPGRELNRHVTVAAARASTKAARISSSIWSNPYNAPNSNEPIPADLAHNIAPHLQQLQLLPHRPGALTFLGSANSSDQAKEERPTRLTTSKPAREGSGNFTRYF